MMDRQGREFDCRTVDASPGDFLIATDAIVEVNQSVVIYFEHLGRVVGRISRVARPGLFAVVSASTPHKREKATEVLTRLINKDRAADLHDRRQERHAGGGSAIIILDTGKQLPAEILDFSFVGCALRSPIRPPIGSWVQVGALHGRVARYFEAGFAVDFQAKPSGT